MGLAQDGVVRIPLNTFRKGPSNLLSSTGKHLSFSQLSKLNSHGVDLSKIYPVEDKYWQNKKYPAVDQKVHNEMPNVEQGLDFVETFGAVPQLGIFSAVVASPKKPSQRVILTLGLSIQSSLMKSALLRKLGYYQYSPKYYNKVKLNFASKEARQQFVLDAFCAADDTTVTDTCLTLEGYKSEASPRQFISDVGETGLYVYGAYLEKLHPEVPSLFDGLTPASGDLLRYNVTSRQFRALVVPFSIGNFSESLMSVAGQVAFVRDGHAVVNYPFPQYFSETESSDVKWMLRRVAALTEQDWDEIVDASHYPQCYKQRVKALLLLRSQNLINTFFEHDEAKQLFQVSIPDIRYDCQDMVKDGRIVKQFLPDYPQRFFYGESESLFAFPDLVQYINIRAMSAAIGVGISKLSEKLDLKRTKILSDKATINGFRMDPNGSPVPIGYVPIQQFGLGIGASRFVTTGTFYGSDAAVQLVDNVSLSANIGYGYIVLDNVGGIGNPLAMLNGAVDFTHVRPLQSMKETKEIPWTDLFVPSKLAKVTAPIKDGNLSEFFANLAVGEVFTITSSVGGGAQYGWNYGLDNIIGFTGSHIPTLGFMAGSNKVILKQLQIIRTPQGFQIFIRKQDTKAFNVAVDFNYFMNLLKIKNDTPVTKLHTDAFILNYNNDYIQQIEKTLETVRKDAKENELDPEEAVQQYFIENPEIEKSYKSKKNFSDRMVGALSTLFHGFSTEKLYVNFKKQRFDIDHGLKTNEIKTKILWWRWSKLNEEHLFKFIKPELVPVEHGEVINKPIEVVTYKKGQMSGRDLFGFGLGVVDAVLKEKLEKFAPVFSQESQNPSQMPFGRAQWHTVRTDVELSQREGRLKPVAVLQSVWGGWSLKKAELDKILEKVRARFKGTEFETKDLIPEETFSTVKKLDFFRITENLSLLDAGLEKIKNTVIDPDATGFEVDKAKFMDRFVQKISELGSNNKARPQDKAIFKNLLTIIGAGNEQLGHKIYMEQCKKRIRQQQLAQQTKGSPPVSYITWSKGTRYECLEPWVNKVISKAREFQRSSERDQARLMTELIYELEENIPLYVLLKAIGPENYLYFVEVTGFKVGAEVNEQGVFVSNVLGEPRNKHPYANGLLSYIAERLGLMPLEIDRTQGSFQ